jgi:hypothetical protein
LTPHLGFIVLLRIPGNSSWDILEAPAACGHGDRDHSDRQRQSTTIEFGSTELFDMEVSLLIDILTPVQRADSLLQVSSGIRYVL